MRGFLFVFLAAALFAGPAMSEARDAVDRAIDRLLVEPKLATGYAWRISGCSLESILCDALEAKLKVDVGEEVALSDKEVSFLVATALNALNDDASPLSSRAKCVTPDIKSRAVSATFRLADFRFLFSRDEAAAKTCRLTVLQDLGES